MVESKPEEKVLSSKSPAELAKELWDTLIIGGGCVGVGAAIYAYRFNMKTLLLSKELGGLITWTHLVENYPGLGSVSGIEMMDKFIAHAKLFDIPLLEGEEVTAVEKAKHGFTVKTKQHTFRTKTIIYATGTTVKQLGVPGEERLKSKGVSYCATCDAAFFRNKTVAMVGSGDSACKEALLLSEFASKVYIIARGDRLKPEPINGKRLAANTKIVPILNTKVLSMEGEQKLTHVVLDRPYEGSTTLKLEGVFIAIGHTANTNIIKPLGVALDAKGEILIDQESKTNVPGFYAAGDVVQSTYKQAITGVAEGVIAAFSAYKHVASGNTDIRAMRCEMVEQLNSGNFDAKVQGLALVDFWAEWCGPCKMMAPVFEKLAPTYHGKPHFFKINVDENQDVTERYGISGIPCLVLLKDGKEVGRIVGFYPEDALKQKINELAVRFA